MHKKLLMVLAVLCQFLVLFPFLVMSEGIGFGEFVWWHYAAMYAAAAGFWAEVTVSPTRVSFTFLMEAVNQPTSPAVSSGQGSMPRGRR